MAIWLTSDSSKFQLRGPTLRAEYVPFGDPANAEGVLQRLRRIVQHMPHAVVVVDDAGAFTFVQLWNASIALAGTIDRQDPGGGPVAILLKSNRSYLVALIACLAAQRVAVLLDASFPDARNHSMIANAGVSLVLGHVASPKTSASLAYLNPAQAIDDTIAARIVDFSGRVDVDQPAIVLATSGSSGSPKLIAHSQRTLWHWARLAHDSMQVTPNDQALSVSSLASLGGITALFGFPLAGASLQLLDVKASGITGLLHCLEREPVTILRGAPSFFRTLAPLEGAREAFARLRIVHMYGEPLLRADLRDLRQVLPTACFVRTSYGSTECSGIHWFADATNDHDEFRVAAGVLMPDTDASVEDEERQCGPGEVGELVIRSRYNALGEWQDGELVPGRLLTDAALPSRRIYRTGDLARYGKDGVFVVLGRKDRMVKINGQRVEPAEIETVLQSIAGVAEFEIMSVLRDGRTLLVACVVTTAGSSGVAESARRRLSAALPSFMVPRVWVVDRLPRLPGGKVDSNALRALLASR